jgi:RNA polymerase sigma-70 factor (ECF subfamily)
VDPQLQEEIEWIERCRHGETRAFAPLVARYERMVRSVIRRLVGREDEVDELAQVTFVTAWERLAQYSATAKFSTWLCQIAVNKCRDRYRFLRRWETVPVEPLEPDALPDETPGPEQQLADKQLDAQLQAALGQLKPQERELIVFKYVEGHDYDMVARILGCTPQAAKVRSVRARAALKEVLMRLGVEP